MSVLEQVSEVRFLKDGRSGGFGVGIPAEACAWQKIIGVLTNRQLSDLLLVCWNTFLVLGFFFSVSGLTDLSSLMYMHGEGVLFSVEEGAVRRS